MPLPRIRKCAVAALALLTLCGAGSCSATRRVPPATWLWPHSQGRIEHLWVEHGARNRAGQKGLRIHVKYRVLKGRGRPVKLIAYFHWASGDKLMDTDGVCCTTDGQVCAAGEVVAPQFDDLVWGQTLFIPYSQLHVDSPGRHRLKFDVWLWDVTRGAERPLAKSQWYEFWLDRK